MMLKTTVFLLAFTLPFMLFAEISRGEQLEREIWNNIKNQEWDIIKAKIDPNYQSINFNGVHNNQQQLEIFKNYHPSDFVFSNFIVNETSDTCIVTYFLEITASLGNKRFLSKAARLSVWKNNNGVWQWMAHANTAIVPF